MCSLGSSLHKSSVIPVKLAIPPEADQPQAEATASRNPVKTIKNWITAFAVMRGRRPRLFIVLLGQALARTIHDPSKNYDTWQQRSSYGFANTRAGPV